MPVLENERWELFAQKLAAGENATSAYESVGFKRSRSNAARLSANENVRRRVSEIQQAAANRAEITLAGILSELDEAISIAKQKGQPNALINAASLRSRLGGLLTERAEIAITTPEPEPTNFAELFAKIIRETGLQQAKALAAAYKIEWNDAEIMSLVNADEPQRSAARQQAIANGGHR
jgi:hypothetical protein